MSTITTPAEMRECPFCDAPSSEMEARHRVQPPQHYVECGNCWAIGPCEDTEDEAIAAWNRRHSLDRIEEMEKALRGLMSADDAMLAFLLAARPEVIGEAEWDRQHKERSAQKRQAVDAAIAALAKAQS